MYRAINKTKAIWIYTEVFKIHTGSPTVHWEDSTKCIYVVKAIRVTPKVKHINIVVCFLQEQYEIFIFITKYEKYVIILAHMCTKPRLGLTISCSTKWMTVLNFTIK